MTATTSSHERRGRKWMALSFLACPCHLPLTIGILLTVFGGSTLGVLLRDHSLIAGLLITSVWIAGTARGLLLVREGQKTGYACAIPEQKDSPSSSDKELSSIEKG